MKTKSGDQIAKALRRSDAALRELEWAQRRIEELKRSADDQRNQVAELLREVEIIRKRDTSIPPEWSARASCAPPNRYQ